MSQTILVRHTIPISDNESGGPHIYFYQWIPENADTILTRTLDNITSRLWLDRSCIGLYPGEINDETLNKWGNISVSKVFVDVEIANVSDELAQFIYDEREGPRGLHHGIQPSHNDYERLKDAYLELGKNSSSRGKHDI
jgi:hypothetical protein